MHKNIVAFIVFAHKKIEKTKTFPLHTVKIGAAGATPDTNINPLV